MGFLDFFRSKDEQELPQKEQENQPVSDLELCTNLRVEVTNHEGLLLFVAQMKYLWGRVAELQQFAGATFEQDPDADPIPVKIRGYNEQAKKAIYLDGIIVPREQYIWRVEDLVVTKLGNDRALFRLDINVDATVTKLAGSNAGEKPCKLLDISIGGARISSEYEYWEHDRLLLTAQLIADREPSIMFCEILRAKRKNKKTFEYGCKFLEMNESDQEKISQNIFAVQRRMRGVY